MSVSTPDTPGTAEDEAFADRWADWHREHEVRRADPHGFLAVTGLYWLTRPPQRVDGVPGLWSTGPDGPLVTLEPGEELVVDGRPVRGSHAFGPIAERDGRTATAGDVEIEVARRGGHDIVRPRDPGTRCAREHRGTPAFAPDPRWAVRGPVRAVLRAAADDGRCRGRGTRARLRGARPGHLHRRRAGAGAHRVRRAGPRQPVPAVHRRHLRGHHLRGQPVAVGRGAGADGTVTLDFNRATNLPCAYTDFATCPLPPAENRLPVAVEAGEQIPTERR